MSAYRSILASLLLVATGGSQLHAQDRTAIRVGVIAPSHYEPSSTPPSKAALLTTERDTLGPFIIGGALVGAVVSTVAAVRGAEVHDPLIFPFVTGIAVFLGTVTGASVGLVVGEFVRYVGR